MGDDFKYGKCVTLPFDARCDTCGIKLPKDTKAYVYYWDDKNISVRCCDCEYIYDWVDAYQDGSGREVQFQLEVIRRILEAMFRRVTQLLERED